eukprot:6333574-Prorocentrum_lima.AAC.1
MTSSLVGSEMCIRDSASGLRFASYVGSASPRKWARLRLAHGLGFASFPVSYTHLTLPTICSV